MTTANVVALLTPAVMIGILLGLRELTARRTARLLLESGFYSLKGFCRHCHRDRVLIIPLGVKPHDHKETCDKCGVEDTFYVYLGSQNR